MTNRQSSGMLYLPGKFPGRRDADSGLFGGASLADVSLQDDQSSGAWAGLGLCRRLVCLATS